MYLKEVRINDFRNYNNLRVQPHRELNFITGPNARGKTNFLESIFFAGLGRTFRGHDRDIIKWDANRASVQAFFYLADCTVEVKAEIASEGKKKILINGADNGRQDMPGCFGIVLFKPDDLQIIKGSPGLRRDFIDNDLGVIEPMYRNTLNKYRRVLAHRNNLLRVGGDMCGENIEIWNEQLYLYGAQVLSLRIRLLKKFYPLVKKAYSEISGAGEELGMRYLSTVKLSNSADAEQITKDFTAEGKAREREELYKKQTIIGPHRDDLVFYLNGKDVRQFGSQGQIRSVVLALKTAQMRLFYQDTGEEPILLLDDVLMELDEARQHYLMDMISGQIQTFITSSTGKEKFSGLQGKIYLVDGFGMKEV